MSNPTAKQYIIWLVEELKIRSEHSYTDIVAWMDAESSGETITRNHFDANFRRFPERATFYPVEEVVNLIRIFTEKLPPHKACKPIEAILLAHWTGLTMALLPALTRLFEKTALQAVFNYFLNEDIQKLDWFDERQRSKVLDAIEHEQKKLDKQVAFDKAQIEKLSEVVQRPQVEKRLAKIISIQDVEYEKYDFAHLMDTVSIGMARMEFQTAQDLLLSALTDQEHYSIYEISEMYHYLGITHIKRSNHQEANQYLERAAKLAEQANGKNLATIIGNMGSNAYYQGDFTKALTLYTESLEQAKIINNPQLMAFSTTSLGAVLEEMFRFDEAMEYFQQALDLAEQLGNPERKALIHLNLGILHFYKQEYEQAKFHYKRGFNYAKQIAHQNILLELYWNNIVLESLHNPSMISPEELHEYGLAAKQMGVEWLHIGISLDIGKVYLFRNQWAIAQKTFEQALWEALQIKNPQFIAKALYGLVIAILVNPHATSTSTNARKLVTDILNPYIIHEIKHIKLSRVDIEKAHFFYQLGRQSAYQFYGDQITKTLLTLLL